jgi:hypothetical protein
MTAPDRIWIDEDTWLSRSLPHRRMTEYIRADLCRAPTQAADAALERAAQVAWDYEDTYGSRGMDDLAKVARNIAAAIRALQSAPAPTALQAALAVPDGLIDALRSGEQADMDGTMVKVSRQACEEAADILAALKAATP